MTRTFAKTAGKVAKERDPDEEPPFKKHEVFSKEASGIPHYCPLSCQTELGRRGMDACPQIAGGTGSR